MNEVAPAQNPVTNPAPAAPATKVGVNSVSAPPASAPAQPPKAPKARIAVWDNARFIFILVVVIGHAISTIRTSTDFTFGLYAFIYLFHMPAMIFLSGMFTKPEVTPKATRAVIQLLVTWVLWEGIWIILRSFVSSHPVRENFLVVPSWTLWFLVSLVTMRVLLPYLLRLRHPLVWSIVFALASSLIPTIDTPFSASRTFAFMPFFVLGYLVRNRGWLAGEWFMRPSMKLRGGAWALLVLLLVGMVLSNLREVWRIDKWLTWRDDYEWLFKNAAPAAWQPGNLFAVDVAGAAIAALLIGAACLLTFAVLLVVPRSHSVITVWGSRTLYVYLLHGPLVWVARETGFVNRLGELGTIGIALLIAMATVLTLVLSMTWVQKVFWPIIEPRFDWLLTREETKKA